MWDAFPLDCGKDIGDTQLFILSPSIKVVHLFHHSLHHSDPSVKSKKAMQSFPSQWCHDTRVDKTGKESLSTTINGTMTTPNPGISAVVVPECLRHLRQVVLLLRVHLLCL